VAGDDSELASRLLRSGEPSVRFATRVGVLGEDPRSQGIGDIQDEIRCSSLVTRLLSERSADGRIPCWPYAKWYGAHWVLALLADLGYPPCDRALYPLRDQVYEFWLRTEHVQSVPVIQGRARRCGSQEGNALYATLALGIADERADQLARNLLRWQWPDGGWNCDLRPEAANSSFHETLIPLRALARYGRERQCAEALEAAGQAAQVFLKRRLYRRQRDGTVIDPGFLSLKYPHYWAYDILFGLKVMSEAGFLGDERCQEALDCLEHKRLPDGGFPAEVKLYHVTSRKTPTGRGASLVDWGGTGGQRTNEFVTAEALTVLTQAKALAC
jgi:hypothetical protein